MSVEAYLEVGAKRVFAVAYDWPGWARTAKTEEAALEALSTYGPRYAAVVEPAGFSLPDAALRVTEQVPGDATTDFGAPHTVLDRDRTRITAAKAQRLADIVEACWTAFDRGVAKAPAALRKGPRGGGRDRDQVVSHVREAERAYAAKLGVRIGSREYGDPAAVAAGRERILTALRAGGGPPETGWPIRYAARRIAWHVLDHLWEIEDKSD